ncbi:MAG: trigger factor [Planctomycetota bacterium]|nr:trigger factor [Planctomycetota bacterium]
MADETNPAEETTPATEEKADNLPENQITVEDSGTLKKKVTITISRERIDAKRNEMFGELSESAQVPGFRIGHAPRRLIEKRFGKEISSDVRNALVGQALGQAVEKTALKTIGEPQIDLDAITLPDTGEMQFSFEVEIVPEFALPELKGIPVKKPALAIGDKQIDEAVDQMRQGMVRYEPTDAKAADGDMVTAGATIAVEGAEPVVQHGLSLRVAPGQIAGLPLVDLGKALVGAKAGSEVSLTVDEVPVAHPTESWHGKKALVTIQVSEVRQRVLPEIDEEYVKTRGYDSLAAFRTQIAEYLRNRLEIDVKMALRQQVREHLLGLVTFDLPEGVAKRHALQAIQRRYVDLMQRGVPRETIEELLPQYQANIEEESAQDLKLSFILSRIAEERKIEVSDGEINARVAEMAQQYNRRPERLRQELEADGSLGSLQMQIAEEKAIDLLLEEAQVTEVSPEEMKEEAQHRKAAKKAKKADEGEKEAKPHKEEKAEKAEKKHADEAKPHKAPKAEKAHDDEKAEKKPAKKAEKKEHKAPKAEKPEKKTPKKGK